MVNLYSLNNPVLVLGAYLNVLVGDYHVLVFMGSYLDFSYMCLLFRS